MRKIKMKLNMVAASVLFIFLVSGCVATRTQESTGEYIDDSTITTQVKSAMVRDPALHGLEINVETYKGIVQLSGFVDNQKIAQQAVADAYRVSGVHTVKNSLITKKSRPTTGKYVDDTTLTTKVKSALVGDSRLSSLDIHVKTHNGVVLLNGFVNTSEAKRWAQEDAQNVRGSHLVINNLIVK